MLKNVVMPIKLQRARQSMMEIVTNETQLFIMRSRLENKPEWAYAFLADTKTIDDARLVLEYEAAQQEHGITDDDTSDDYDLETPHDQQVVAARTVALEYNRAMVAVSDYEEAEHYIHSYDIAKAQLMEWETIYGLQPMNEEELRVAASDKAENERQIALFGYRSDRLKRYPPIGDQLDMIWQYLGTLTTLPIEVKAMSELIKKIKAGNPKPKT